MEYLLARILVVLAIPGFLCAAPPKTSSWSLSFDDEFDGLSLDTTKWHPHDHFCGVRNDELQAYMPENITVANGLCREKCEKRTVNYGYCGQPSIVKDYASAMMVTMDKFDQKFGYFEMRCKIPKGKGLWPAFWLLPYNKWPPEIDILEILCHEPNKIYMTNHYTVNGQHQSKGGAWTGSDFSADFHTFGVEWDSSKIVWYVDGVERFRSTSGVPAEPFFILVNLALGGAWPGAPDSTTILPAYFDIDWVRVYKKAGTIDAARLLVITKENAQFSITRLKQGFKIVNNKEAAVNVKLLSLNGKTVDEIALPGHAGVTVTPKQHGMLLLEGIGGVRGQVHRIIW
jgi:beta-glucanase (GH16 family)